MAFNARVYNVLKLWLTNQIITLSIKKRTTILKLNAASFLLCSVHVIMSILQIHCSFENLCEWNGRKWSINDLSNFLLWYQYHWFTRHLLKCSEKKFSSNGPNVTNHKDVRQEKFLSYNKKYPITSSPSNISCGWISHKWLWFDEALCSTNL